MHLKIQGIPTSDAKSLQAGEVDAYGQKPQLHLAEGANPCRHCLQLIAEGENKLVLAYNPFPTKQPYAETGPIFLHEKQCERYESNRIPEWFIFLEPALIRGYDENDWIIYETGDVVSGSEIENKCVEILANTTVAYVHIRSKYNCFQCRVDRA